MSEWLGGTPEQDEDEPLLFDVEPDWTETWKGMPEFEQKDLTPSSSLLVHFVNKADRDAFAKFVQQTLTSSTKSIWFPKAEIARMVDKVFTSKAPVQPRHPLYIVSKGRWETRLTSKSLHRMGVKHYIIVEEQEVDRYAAVLDSTATIVVLDPRFKAEYDACDDLGDTKSKGPGAARNFAWAHSLSIGATWHWVMDDNIDGFYRLIQNLKTPVATGAIFRCMEDFCERYSNVGMAGPNYFMFASRKSEMPPYVLNTRIYSCNLIRNDLPYRWRGRYNEDTDLSLRILKDGLCTVQFNAFLQYKMTTQTVKGGCDTDFYSVEGTKPKSEMQVKLHPDCSELVWKFGRWHHHVDYRRFRVNELKLKPGVVVPKDVDDYGMTLEILPTPSQAITQPSAPRVVAPRRVETPRAAGPSALSFIQNLAGSQPVPAALESAKPKPSQPEEKPALASPQPESGPFEPTYGGRVEPFAVNVHAEPEIVNQVLEPIVDGLSAAEIKLRLDIRGHQLLTQDGRFFVSDAGKLTLEEKAIIKAQREELILLAQPFDGAVAGVSRPSVNDAERTVPSPSFDTLFEDRPTQTLAQFLGSEPSRVDSNYVADEPPDLTGIDEIVLNFATTGLKWREGDRPVGVTVASLDGALCHFLPFGFRGKGHDEAAIKRWANDQLRGKKIYNSNTKFDIHMARVWGCDLEANENRFTDIGHTGALLGDRRKVGIDALASDYLPGNIEVPRVDESRHAEHHASEVDARERYTARLIGKLVAAMYPEIDKQELRAVQDLEDETIPPVVEMEKNRPLLDLARVEQYHAEANRRHDELLWEISKECGFAFDHTPKSWQRLFETLGLPPTDGNAEAVIKGIDHPLVQKAHLAAQYFSLDSKTFKPYLENMDSNGLLNCDINQLRSDDGGTVSGRFSIGYIQQVPNSDNHKAVFGDTLFPRDCFIAATGVDTLEADAMQIEQRILSIYADNAEINQGYGGDLERLLRGEEPTSFHKITWAMIKRYKPDMLYSHQKSFNFARAYGAKSIKLAVMMGFITEKEGDEIRRAKRWDDPRLKTIKEIEAAYHRMMPEGDALLERAAHLAKPECDEYCKKGDALHRQWPHRGYVKTWLGRRARFPTNYKTHSALNRIIQGNGADLLKMKLVELHRERKRTGFVMRMTVHDSVGGDATTPETKQLVSGILNRQSTPRKIPILWSVKTGRTWAECK
jgi:DNA polymerase I-like protein with 3'-5' exonuclease and polymerase domains